MICLLAFCRFAPPTGSLKKRNQQTVSIKAFAKDPGDICLSAAFFLIIRSFKRFVNRSWKIFLPHLLPHLLSCPSRCLQDGRIRHIPFNCPWQLASKSGILKTEHCGVRPFWPDSPPCQASFPAAGGRSEGMRSALRRQGVQFLTPCIVDGC